MPVIWLIDAYRAGERGQVRALANTLGWPCEIKTLDYRKSVVLPHVLGRSSLRGITAAAADTLRAPWPDLVISSGVRNEPVCRWIREQSRGRTRYVHVGRPWGSLDSFDLVVTTPQYRVPASANVLNNVLTLHSITPAALAAARDTWSETFAALPRPYFAVIVGGSSGPFTLGPRAAARLGQRASRLARNSGGSLLVTTSSRTGDQATESLRSAIDVPHYFYRWRSDGRANPYAGILACADRMIVTADSIAMLSEACATGKPVHMFDLGGMRPGADTEADFQLSALLYRWLMRWFWQPLSRDITLVHQQLHASGRAVWLEDQFSVLAVPGETDMQRAVAAVKALFQEV